MDDIDILLPGRKLEGGGFRSFPEREGWEVVRIMGAVTAVSVDERDRGEVGGGIGRLLNGGGRGGDVGEAAEEAARERMLAIHVTRFGTILATFEEQVKMQGGPHISQQYFLANGSHDIRRNREEGFAPPKGGATGWPLA